jgi:hypothetical protein
VSSFTLADEVGTEAAADSVASSASVAPGADGASPCRKCRCRRTLDFEICIFPRYRPCRHALRVQAADPLPINLRLGW